MANPTIGHLNCPITGNSAEVRRNATGKRLFYYYSTAGMITPNLPDGQKWILNNTKWIDEKEPLDLDSLLARYGIDKKDEREAKPKKKSFLDSFLHDDE